MTRPGFRTAASLLLLALAANAAQAQSGKKKEESPQNQPALLTADQMVFDRDLNLITARGHVEIDQGGQVVKADALSYNLKQDVIIATGHVSFTQITGDINFADYLEVTGDMKQATARSLRVLMFDDSRLAGRALLHERTLGRDGQRLSLLERFQLRLGPGRPGPRPLAKAAR